MDRGNPTARSGFVNFPTSDPRYTHTGEGGLFVRLVVVPTRDADFMVCAGGEVRFLADGVLVGDDVTEPPARPVPPGKDGQNPMGRALRSLRLLFPGQDQGQQWHEYTDRVERRKTFLTDVYFQESISSGRHAGRRLSMDLLAALTLGSTGWAGFDEAEQLYWRCRYADLTAPGQQLYDGLRDLYAGTGYPALQTWLDR
jgi:hypothetical protein